MNPALQELKNAAAGLPASEPAELVQFLLRSLDEPDENQVLRRVALPGRAADGGGPRRTGRGRPGGGGAQDPAGAA